MVGRRWIWMFVALTGAGLNVVPTLKGSAYGGLVAAQIGAAALAGRIVDQKGGALPGTTVTVVSVGNRRLTHRVCRF